MTTESRPTFPAIWMQMAVLMSMRSSCSRLRVGCVIVTPNNKQVLAVGYNGGAAGQENECASLEPGQCGHLHAEVNAALKAPADVAKVAYVTHLPCAMCAKALVNLGGLVGVHYLHDYRVRDSLDILRRAGITTARFVDPLPLVALRTGDVVVPTP